MWLFTKYGFFSVVCAKDRKTGKPLANLMQIRARDKAHMETLKEVFRVQLADAEITETQHTDYRFRMIVSRSVWHDLAIHMAEDVDYSNFKSAAGASWGVTDRYVDALHTVWSTMLALQPRNPFFNLFSNTENDRDLFMIKGPDGIDNGSDAEPFATDSFRRVFIDASAVDASAVEDAVPMPVQNAYFNKKKGKRKMVCPECKGKKTTLLDGNNIRCLRCNGRGSIGGLLVEDATVVGGIDKKTGAPVIKPKTTAGKADESVEPTDTREKSDVKETPDASS